MSSTIESVEGLPSEELLEMVGATVRGMLETRDVVTTLLAELRRRNVAWDRIHDETQISQELATITLGPDFRENVEALAKR